MEWIQIRDGNADTSERLRDQEVLERPEMENQLTFNVSMLSNDSIILD